MSKHRLFQRISNRQSAGALARTAGQPATNLLNDPVLRGPHALERRLRLAALRAERAELYRLRAADQVNDATLRRLVREVDLVEAALTESPS